MFLLIQLCFFSSASVYRVLSTVVCREYIGVYCPVMACIVCVLILMKALSVYRFAPVVTSETVHTH